MKVFAAVGGMAHRRGFSMLAFVIASMTTTTVTMVGAAEPVTLRAVSFGADAFPAGDHTEFNKLYLPFRQDGGEFSYGANLVSSPGAVKPYNYTFESQYGAFGGSTPTLRLTIAASGNSIAGLGTTARVSEFYELSVDSIRPPPAGATKVAVELPVRISLLATQLPPGPADVNTVSEITATITKTERSSPTIQYLTNIIGACLNIYLPVCDGNSVTFETVLRFDVNPNVPTRLNMFPGGSVRPAADGSFDGYAHGSIDPLPRLSLSADPQAYGLPAGSTFSDYYALRFSPNLYTVAQLPAPEPATWLLALLGFGALALQVPERTTNRGFGRRIGANHKGRPPSRPRRLTLWMALLLALSPLAHANDRAIVVNGQALGTEQIASLEITYRVRLVDGRYWYDRATGWWGTEGGPVAGAVMPGLPVGGSLAADASRGNSGVFINGRELHALEIAHLRTLGPVLPGRYWADATGNVGVEGNSWPFTNLYVLAQQRHGDLGPHRAGSGAFNSDGTCMYYQGKDASGNSVGASKGC